MNKPGARNIIWISSTLIALGQGIFAIVAAYISFIISITAYKSKFITYSNIIIHILRENIYSCDKELSKYNSHNSLLNKRLNKILKIQKILYLIKLLVTNRFYNVISKYLPKKFMRS
jgi:hypothetical protein